MLSPQPRGFAVAVPAGETHRLIITGLEEDLGRFLFNSGPPRNLSMVESGPERLVFILGEEPAEQMLSLLETTWPELKFQPESTFHRGKVTVSRGGPAMLDAWERIREELDE